MSSDRLLQNVVSILLMTGYNVSERCEIRPRSFDLMTSNGEHLFVIKVVSQIDSVNEDVAETHPEKASSMIRMMKDRLTEEDALYPCK